MEGIKYVVYTIYRNQGKIETFNKDIVKFIKDNIHVGIMIMRESIT